MYLKEDKTTILKCFLNPLAPLLFLSKIHDCWQMTNLNGNSGGSFLVLIFYSHHNRQAVIVVLISKRQEDRFDLICIAAAQMFALKTNQMN